MATYQERVETVKKILQKFKSGILSSLDPKNVLLTMQAELALTPEDVTEIESKIVKMDKVISLLDKLMHKPISSFNTFMVALENDRPDLYGEVNKIALAHNYNYKDEGSLSSANLERSDQNPTRGVLTDAPTASHKSFSPKANIDHSTTTSDEEKVNYAVGCYMTAKSKGKGLLDIAEYIRDEFNRRYETSWHCIVGEGYSQCTESDSGCRIKFTVGEDVVYLFRHRIGTEPKPSPRFYPHISPSDRKLIHTSHMDTEMEYHVFDCCKRACDWYTDNDQRAKFIKEEFDKEHNSGWNCILGGDFAFYVHRSRNCFIDIPNFGKDALKILLFRC